MLYLYGGIPYNGCEAYHGSGRVPIPCESRTGSTREYGMVEWMGRLILGGVRQTFFETLYGPAYS